MRFRSTGLGEAELKGDMSGLSPTMDSSRVPDRRSTVTRENVMALLNDQEPEPSITTCPASVDAPMKVPVHTPSADVSKYALLSATLTCSMVDLYRHSPDAAVACPAGADLDRMDSITDSVSSANSILFILCNLPGEVPIFSSFRWILLRAMQVMVSLPSHTNDNRL